MIGQEQKLIIAIFGSDYFSSGEYKKAIEYYQKDLDTSIAVGDGSRIASNNSDLGHAYQHLGEYKKAVDYYQQGLEMSKAIGDRSGVEMNYGNLGDAYFSLGEYKKAIDNYQMGLDIIAARVAICQLWQFTIAIWAMPIGI